MKNNVKVIFHVDLNQFFAQVAMLHYPHLVDKVFAIGREMGNKGVISTASYAARKYKIHAGMAISEAYKKYPNLLLVSPDFRLYEEHSLQFFDFLRQYDPQLEQTSIDECYMDVTNITLGCNRHPISLAKEIQKLALEELNLPCSIGIAPTLFLAKMASDMKKPLGITVIRIRDVEEILYPLPMRSIYGIGKRTYPSLEAAGIMTIKDFITKKGIVCKFIGEKYYLEVCASIHGKSTNIVDPNRHSTSESISRSQTFDQYLVNDDKIKIELFRMSRDMMSELLSGNYLVKTVSITLRNRDFKTITRSKSVDLTNDLTILNMYIEDLIDLHYNGEELRLIGCGFHNLQKKENLEEEINLFNYNDIYGKTQAVSKLMNDFKDKYGDYALFYLKSGNHPKKDD